MPAVGTSHQVQGSVKLEGVVPPAPVTPAPQASATSLAAPSGPAQVAQPPIPPIPQPVALQMPLLPKTSRTGSPEMIGIVLGGALHYTPVYYGTEQEREQVQSIVRAWAEEHSADALMVFRAVKWFHRPRGFIEGSTASGEAQINPQPIVQPPQPERTPRTSGKPRDQRAKGARRPPKRRPAKSSSPKETETT